MKPLPLNESDRGNIPDTPSNSRSGTPSRLRRAEENHTCHPRTTNPAHVPSSRCHRCRPQSASAPGLPPKLHADAGANIVAADGARGHRSTTRMPPPPRHPCLNRLISRSIPNHRTDGLVKEGSEESLFSTVIVAAETKTMNSLKI